MGMKHTWHPILLDGGVHLCMRCHAIDEELAPECAGVQLAHLDRSKQKAINLKTYGPESWEIIVYRGKDVVIETVVKRGLNVAPE